MERDVNGVKPTLLTTSQPAQLLYREGGLIAPFFCQIAGPAGGVVQVITPVIIYVKAIIPAKARIQNWAWMPDPSIPDPDPGPA